MRKYTKIILIILILLIGIFVIYSKSNISLKEMKKIVSNTQKNPENVYIKVESTDATGTEYINEIYKKDSKVYCKQYQNDIGDYEEDVWNLENNKKIIINHISKKIYSESLGDYENINPVSAVMNSVAEEINFTDLKYEYLGKEKVNEIDCFKFSLTEDNISKSYFYIDTNKNNVIKIENGSNYNDKFEIITTYNYHYSYNVVKEEDILKFDISKYPDYEYIEN